MTTPAGIYNVEDFGVVGDGVTDDGPAINAMIAGALEGSRFFFPDDEYLIGEPIVIARDGITLIGRAGLHNPGTSDASTVFTAGPDMTDPVITWDKGAWGGGDDPDTVMMGGGLQHILVSGSDVCPGIRLVKCRHVRLTGFGVRSCVGYALSFDVQQKAVADIWNQTMACVAEHFQIVVTGACDGIRIAANTGGGGSSSHSNLISDFHITVEDGYAIDHAGGDDYVIGPRWAVLLISGGTGSIRLRGRDYGTDITGSSWGMFLGGYPYGVPVRSEAVGYDSPSFGHLFLGLSEVDHGDDALFDSDVGAEPSYLLQSGAHNLFIDTRRSARFYEDFGGGTLASGGIGQLGWFWNGTGAVSHIASAVGHPGITRLSTSAASGTICAIGLGAGVTDGILLPDEAFDATFLLRLLNTDANTQARIGFAAGVGTDPPTDGIYLETLFADSAWYFVCRSGGTQTRSSAILATTTGWIRVRLRRVNSTTIGAGIGYESNNNDDSRITTNVPTADLAAFFQLKNSAAADKLLDADAFQLQIRNLAR